MTKPFEASSIPFNYPMCLNKSCSQSNTCLHQLAMQNSSDSLETCVILNPKLLAKTKESCTFYRSNKKSEYAKGMTEMLNELPHRITKTFRNALINHFSSRTFYRIRSGERLISPKEQQEIATLLNNCGINKTPSYDSYVMEYDW